MISWIGKPEQRIISWRHFRQHLQTLSLSQAINETCKVWSESPKVNKPTIDESNLSEWPTPWQLLENNIYCDLRQNLGIFYTLKLSKLEGIKQLNFCVEEKELHYVYYIRINNKQLINAQHGKIVNTRQQKSLVNENKIITLFCSDAFNFLREEHEQYSTRPDQIYPRNS